MTRGLRSVAALLAATVITGCGVATGISSPNQFAPFRKPVAAVGDTVIVEWSARACAELRRVLVDETDDEVRIELLIRETSDSCDDVIEPRRTTIPLERPLGDRAIVDNACGALPDHPDCTEGS